MRQIYADESGISALNPVVLVAGVMINTDTQWRAVSVRVSELLKEYAPGPIPKDFHFHATDMYSGSGKFFEKNIYPRAALEVGGWAGDARLPSGAVSAFGR